MLNCKVFENLDQAAAACAERITSSLKDAVTKDGRAAIAVSGGSTPKPLFRCLADANLPWGRVHVFWADERMVPPEHPESNFRLAWENWLSKVAIPEENLHRIKGELPPQRAAEEYASELKAFFGGPPHFDVLHLGMGADGHTASLFPCVEGAVHSDGLAQAFWIPKLRAWRVSLTAAALRSAKNTLVLVAGADKAETLCRVFRQQANPEELPIALLAGASNVRWYVDASAGRQLGLPH